MNDGLNWSQLGTVAGVASAVVILTQILKRYIPKIDPKWIALALAVFITFSHQIINGNYSFGSFVLSALNSIISVEAAIGAFETLIKPVERHKDE